MGKRHPNHRLVKIHRNYTVEEIAKLFGFHKNTVRIWIKNGLSTIDNKRPMLILGKDLEDFIKKRRTKNKKKCKPGEIYCVRCRSPKFPAEGMADFSFVTDKIGNLEAICPDCASIMNQRVSMAKLDQIRKKIDITIPKAQQHIVESNKPIVNSDLR